jgi:hypothetical protein
LSSVQANFVMLSLKNWGQEGERLGEVVKG